MTRLLDLEKRILQNYETLSEYEKILSFTERPEELNRSKFMIDKFRIIIQYYLKLYLRICKQSHSTVKEDIRLIAADIVPDVFDQIADKNEITVEGLHTTISGTKIIKIIISQMFRMVDLLTSPQTVRVIEFYEMLMDVEKYRRALNRPKTFKLRNLGVLSPVISTSETYDNFWRPALPDLKFATIPPLTFIPFELTLGNRLDKLNWSPESVLEEPVLQEIAGMGHILQNTQVSSRLRLYPPGTGVIRISLTLEFKSSLHVEAAAQIARRIQETSFVDPEGSEKEFKTFLLETVDEVINGIFREEGLDYRNRCWLPPTTTYCIYDTDNINPEDYVNELSYLMRLAPENEEPPTLLSNRILRALKSAHWQKDRTLTAVGEKVALIVVAQTYAKGKKNKRQTMVNWLLDTHEMVGAAAYAQLAFAEEIENIIRQVAPDNAKSLIDLNGNHFKYLLRLLETLYRVLQAILSIRFHLQQHGAGILMAFAKDIWMNNEPNTRISLENTLNHMIDWLESNTYFRLSDESSELASILRNIKKVALPFSLPTKGYASASSYHIQEGMERQLLEELFELDRSLNTSGIDTFQDIENGLRRASFLANRLSA